MNQTRLQSLYEQFINIGIGFAIGLLSQLFIFPMVGMNDVPFGKNVEIALWFTVVSIIRGYLIRRYFNLKLQKAAKRLAGERS